jgi:hypothetical protein
MMSQFNILQVVGDGVQALGLAHDFIWRDENELNVLVDGFFDEPGTCNAIDLDAVAG